MALGQLSKFRWRSRPGLVRAATAVQTCQEGPLPTVLHVHGGPSGSVSDNFDASSQAWHDHGFAFLTVNYRGSTGSGRDFQEKIQRRCRPLGIGGPCWLPAAG